MKNNWNGWIKIHRKLLEWEWYDDIKTFRLFMHLLLKANYEPKKWHGVTIDRGQFLTSLNTLAMETGLTRQQVRTALTHLISTHEITQEITHQFTIITICKYDSNQGEDIESNTASNTQSNTAITQHQHSDNTASTLTKEDKENKEIKNKKIKVVEKNIIKKENTPKFNFKSALIELGVEPQMAEEWATIRKAKNKVNTEIALHREVSQMNKAGLSVADAVNFCIEYQWGQFRADWYFNSQYSAKPTQRGGGGPGFSAAQMQAIVDVGVEMAHRWGSTRKD